MKNVETYFSDNRAPAEVVAASETTEERSNAPEVSKESWPSISIPNGAFMLNVADQTRRVESASIGRRLAAGVIDRLLPLPFLATFFWPWALVVIAYDLGRDAQGASFGKRLMGLRTVMVSPDPALDGQPCTAGRSLLRNLLWAGARLCYLSVVLVPVGIVLDVTGCLMVLLTPEGRHLGDRIGGTRVVVAANQTQGQGGSF